jgi:Tfp pilus assembly protein PilF
MSTTLNLADGLLARGRKFQGLGRYRDALVALSRLASFRDLSREVAEETQARLAEIQIQRHKYSRARRHLTAALTHQPDNAHYHHLMATALVGDERGDLHRAAEHYRKSLQAEPNQPACLAEFGRLALRLGQVEEGLNALRRAAALAPDDPDVIGPVAECLRREGWEDEARSVLRAALFRNARDGRFRKLWQDFQYHLLRLEQEAARRAEALRNQQEAEPVILPFVRVVPERPTAAPSQKIIRRDFRSPTGRRHAPPARIPDQRNA